MGVLITPNGPTAVKTTLLPATGTMFTEAEATTAAQGAAKVVKGPPPARVRMVINAAGASSGLPRNPVASRTLGTPVQIYGPALQLVDGETVDPVVPQ